MKRLALILIGLSFVLPGTLQAQEKPQRPAASSGTLIVPETYLRRWDPVTIFFASPTGKASGPEDDPGRYMKMSPEHPGAFTWLDSRTLQFRPAEPWPPLQRFTWTPRSGGGSKVTLTTLMSAPVRTIPSANATGLDPVEAITLTFPEPLAIEALREMVTIELRPLPGISTSGSRWLTQEDFTIKAMERTSRSDQATYVVALSSPIPGGTRALVHLRLSLDEDNVESFAEVAFSTAEPFRTVRVGCGSQWYPLTPEGSRYTRDQALNCGSYRRSVSVEFSAAPEALTAVEGRNLLRFTPAVEELEFSVSGRTLTATGDFDWDHTYQVTVAPHPIHDAKGRDLQATGESVAFFFFPRKSPYLRWGTGQGVVERYGPKMVPIEGRGYTRVDLRVHKVDPLNRSLWPFPASGIAVDESARPPGPGEEPAAHTSASSHIQASQLAAHVQMLGSPPVSKLIELPLRKEGSAATFGLDLSPYLSYLSGKNEPGTYLVGIRQLDKSSQRSWMRIQVTDLTLTTLEAGDRVRFLVGSLSSGRPVQGATVSVEGARGGSWVTLAEGKSNADGVWEWVPPAKIDRHGSVRRLVVRKGSDMLVLDPTQPPPVYRDNNWSNDYQTWLQWTQSSLAGRVAPSEDLCHIFTERPVYRPDEKVHIKGYMRVRHRGTLSVGHKGHATVVVDGPGDLQWRYPVEVSAKGSFYHVFDEEKLPTGSYSARISVPNRGFSCNVTFSKEAYRIPRFEVKLGGPDRVPLDREFEIDLVASYYAGGRVSGQDVSWRVTQFPYYWSPSQQLEGFVYSSDSRFSGGARFESSGRLDKHDTTDGDGSASLLLNPAIEPTAQPRSYVIEATVTGADDQTVSTTRRVVALPPFVLGLNVDRFVEKAEVINPQVVVLDHEGQPLAGQEVTVRLLNRQWHSHLRASDFSDGVARYITDVVDETVLEKKVVSTSKPITVELPINRSGVYIVELSSRDRLGRAQVVSVDLYAGGDDAMTWTKPPTQVFEVTTDKDEYAPGETATYLLRSPFQQAMALAIVEKPDGNHYEWIRVRGGAATYRVPVERTFVPRLPVHFVLMRGRVPGTQMLPGSQTDLGKPATMAATQWIGVKPIENTIDVTLEYPEKAQPGDEVEVRIALADHRGKPLSGEVTLWLVDQAVLALGKEQPLDPLPHFITSVRSRFSVHDTRNLAFGRLAFAEMPGGDEMAAEEASADELLDQVTVRKRFESVPYFNPDIRVGSSGTATVKVQLPDNLTNFKIRAKAISGPERFGFAKGHLAVRLPVIVQPALPRFVRPGDQFVATAIGRIVEGGGGAGRAQLRATGVQVDGGTNRSFDWVKGTPSRLGFDVRVEDPPYTEDGRIAYDEITFTVGVERTADNARDAFQVTLPVRDDRHRVRLRTLSELDPEHPLEIPALDETPRPGTLMRTLLVSDQSSLIRMAAGLDFLLEYPYGCTEQRLSRTRSQIAFKKFRSLLHMSGNDEELDRAVRDTLQWLPTVVDDNGLVAYWPGSTGYVSLTAWSSDFLVEAKAAGYPVDADLEAKLHRALEQALRSDYSHFIDGESWAERTMALNALANAGKFEPAYAAELARKAKYLDLESIAQLLVAFDRAKGKDYEPDEKLIDELWKGIVFRLHQGDEIYGGLQWRHTGRNGLILPSETRTTAEITRALGRLDADEKRFDVLLTGLVNLGRGDGWGSTNANASALLALSEVVSPPFKAAHNHAVDARVGSKHETLKISPDVPVGFMSTTETGSGTVRLSSGSGPVIVRTETTYIPDGDGSTVKARSKGFVVTRELYRIDTSGAGAPPVRIELEEAGKKIDLSVGHVLEEHVEVVNPKDRHYVAIVVPLAAGVEPMNPTLKTASSDATPSKTLSLSPTYTAYMDDHVAYYYNTLPKGTFHFYFRTQATIEGSFSQPPARAEMMYDETVFGHSVGARLQVRTLTPK